MHSALICTVFSYLTLAFSVNDVLHAGEPLATAVIVLGALVGITDVADFFCLIPIHSGACFLKGGYQFSSYKISELVQGNFQEWETLALRELPEGAMQCLPPLPFVHSVELQLRSEVRTVLAQIEALVVWREKVEAIGVSGNRFEKQLHDRYKTQLLEAEHELGVQVGEIRNRIHDVQPANLDSDKRRVALETLQTIQIAAQNNDIYNLIASGKLDMANLPNW